MNNNITLYLDDIAIELIYVEGTDENGFLMGGVTTRNNSLPIHPVCLSSYYIGKYAVTQSLWKKVMGKQANISRFQRDKNRPIENVSWNDIMQEDGFLTKLNENKELKSQIKENEVLQKIFKDKNINTLSFQLPTEAQWEYAARGGKEEWHKNYKYAGSNNKQEVSWYKENSHNEIKPIGLKRPNGLDIYDMSGNVWEWCKDGYDRKYYQKNLLKFDKKSIPLKNPCNEIKKDWCIVRGGAWNSSYHNTIVLARLGINFIGRYRYVGFRLLFA